MKYLGLFVFILSGCASQPCKPTLTENKKTSMVYKYDGSLQCGMGTEVTLEQMERELKNIKVYSKSKKRDGLMRTQVCGAGSGQANVYEISQDQVPQAEKLGFKTWNF